MAQQKTISGRDLSKTITSEDILGNKVIDREGTFVGVVEKVLIDPETIEVVGISVDKGFLRRGLTIGKTYIASMTKHAILLNIRVAHDIKGKSVFDSEGRAIGRVSSIELLGGKNTLTMIIVRTNRLLKKDLAIPAEYIEAIGENVMLTTTEKKLREKAVKAQ